MARDVVGIDLGTTNTVIYRFRFDPGTEMNNTGPFPVSIFYLSAPVIKCKKTPVKKCSFVAERRKKR